MSDTDSDREQIDRYTRISRAVVQGGALLLLALVMYGAHLYLEAHQTHIHDLVKLMLERCLPQPGTI